MLQPCHQKDIERKYITFLTLIVETTKNGILYAINNLPDHGCSQQKTAKTVHRMKHSHHWSRIDTGFDVSKFL